MARRSRKKPPDLEQVRRDLAEVMDLVRHYIVTPHRAGEDLDAQHLTRLTTSYVQTVQTYLRAVDAHELAERIEALEQQVGGRQ